MGKDELGHKSGGQHTSIELQSRRNMRWEFHDWIPDGEAWQFQGYDESGFPDLWMEDSWMHTKC